MSLLEVNLSDIPLVRETIPSGIYELEIETAEVKAAAKAESGMNLVVGLKVLRNMNGDESMNGRKITDYINLKDITKAVRLRQLVKSAGIDDGKTLNTDDLLGKVVRGVNRESTYTDKVTGNIVASSNISEYMFSK